MLIHTVIFWLRQDLTPDESATSRTISASTRKRAPRANKRLSGSRSRRGGRDRRGLAVGGGGDDLAEEGLLAPALQHELDGQPVEKLRVRRPLALRAEVLDCADEAAAEEGLPVAVGRDVLVSGFSGLYEPPGEAEPVRRLVVGQAAERGRHRRVDALARAHEAAAVPEQGGRPLEARALRQHGCRHDLHLVELGLDRAQAIAGGVERRREGPERGEDRRPLLGRACRGGCARTARTSFGTGKPPRGFRADVAESRKRPRLDWTCGQPDWNARLKVKVRAGAAADPSSPDPDEAPRGDTASVSDKAPRGDTASVPDKAPRGDTASVPDEAPRDVSCTMTKWGRPASSSAVTPQPVPAWRSRRRTRAAASR